MMNQDEHIGPVNIGNPTENSMLELAEAVLEVTGSSSKVIHEPLPQDDPKRRCPDITLAKSLLNWEPKVDLKAGLEQIVNYYKETQFQS